jgi:hypothetical protein
VTTYYVGSGGNDSNAGTSWAQRKLTLNGVEDIPVAAGDTVYVAPGVYRETLTVDVSGSAGSPITYIGDYTGANTDGTGGVVRITGSDDDIVAARNYCVSGSTRSYRTFRGFAFDTAGSHVIYGGADSRTNWVIEQCVFYEYLGTTAGVHIEGASQGNWTIQNCAFFGVLGAYGGLNITHSGTVDNAGHVIQNCIFETGWGVLIWRVGGIVIKNCSFIRCPNCGVYVVVALSIGQTITVNNCTFSNCFKAFEATAVGEIVENYNSIYGCTSPRTKTNTGANSNAYPPLFDTRWFFEMVGGGSMVTPFDLSAWSQLLNVAGTSPTTTDMRGTAVQGAQREWGALEYDSTLDIEASSGGGGRPAFGDRTGGKF